MNNLLNRAVRIVVVISLLSLVIVSTTGCGENYKDKDLVETLTQVREDLEDARGEGDKLGDKIGSNIFTTE